MNKLIRAAAVAAFLTAGSAQAATIYSNDFSGAVVMAPGVSVVATNASGTGTATAGSWNASGWAGTFLRNSSVSPVLTTSFAFSGIGAHSGISLGGLLGLLESWDSTNGSPAPDWLEVLIDGTVVAAMTSNTASGSVVDSDGGAILAIYDQIDTNFSYSDTLIDFGGASWATFAHSASTLTVEFRAAGSGWQGGSDESWGLDNFTVAASGAGAPGVPEPATWAMMIGGFALAGAAMRRRATALRFA